MRKLSSFSRLLFTFILLFLTSNPAVASFASEAAEIPYQIDNSDRIVIGTVSELDMARDHTIATIKVQEWLYNPLSVQIIKVRSERGTNIVTENEPQFVQNEPVLLMLNDVNPDEQLFRVAIGEPGKHPVSDRNAVVEELKARGKWKGEDQTVNQTNEVETLNNIKITGNQQKNSTENNTVGAGKEENTGTINKKEVSSNSTQKSNATPFISSFWIFAIVFGTIICIRKMK
ncbi:MAG: hypothetical protein ACPK85_14805 [Methanosarcina sp.]